MSICPATLGYNWESQLGREGKLFDDWKDPLMMNAFKIVDYIPLISIISGICKIAMGVFGLFSEWNNMNTHERCDSLLFTARGVVATLQLGIVFLPIDVIMTIVNGILSHKLNQQIR